mgnify:CR=1 FL=1
MDVRCQQLMHKVEERRQQLQKEGKDYFKRRTIRDCKRQYRLSDSSDDLGEGNLKQESENRELFAGKEKRIADACPHASIKNGHPHRMPKRKKVMKKKNDIYKLGCCLLLNNRRIF